MKDLYAKHFKFIFPGFCPRRSPASPDSCSAPASFHLPLVRFAVVAALYTTIGVATAADKGGAVIVNGKKLDQETLAHLQQIYPVQIAPGRYWYDPISGAYGIEGSPISGQMLPGLRLGGPLRADASHGTSGVFINGRQLTLGEKQYIEQSCRSPVMPGRYWVNAQGLGGYENMMPSFNLAACGAQDRSHGGGSSTRTYCEPDGSCRSSGILGSILTAPN